MSKEIKRFKLLRSSDYPVFHEVSTDGSHQSFFVCMKILYRLYNLPKSVPNEIDIVVYDKPNKYTLKVTADRPDEFGNVTCRIEGHKGKHIMFNKSADELLKLKRLAHVSVEY